VSPPAWSRRAQPLLGTLVEVGVPFALDAKADAAFDRIREVEAALSRFRADSDIGRFNALPAGASLAIGEDARCVLAAAASLREATDGRFDISIGTGVHDWALDGITLRKLAEGVRLDLGGIGKGHAVDVAIEALIAAGVASCWVNAGGDLRVHGELALPVHRRDEVTGGAEPFALLSDGAMTTSHLGDWQVTVAAPRCLWADALTKVVAFSGDVEHPLLATHGASAWRRPMAARCQADAEAEDSDASR
jgi:thiamine biosynthesis lipoprotein